MSEFIFHRLPFVCSIKICVCEGSGFACALHGSNHQCFMGVKYLGPTMCAQTTSKRIFMRFVTEVVERIVFWTNAPDILFSVLGLRFTRFWKTLAACSLKGSVPCPDVLFKQQHAHAFWVQGVHPSTEVFWIQSCRVTWSVGHRNTQTVVAEFGSNKTISYCNITFMEIINFRMRQTCVFDQSSLFVSPLLLAVSHSSLALRFVVNVLSYELWLMCAQQCNLDFIWSNPTRTYQMYMQQNVFFVCQLPKYFIWDL